MKVILSRKGYDTENGGYPSPILPDGDMVSFPIPTPDQIGIASTVLKHKERLLSELFQQLGHTNPLTNHHLDPDLGIYTVNGKTSMAAGIFGQSQIAAGHLINQEIGIGDIFLFFGTFQNTIEHQNILTYKHNESPIQSIYGYLIVDEIVTDIAGIPTAFGQQRYQYHPHFLNNHHPSFQPNNRMFISHRYGYFNYDDCLRLSAVGENISLWSLPPFFNGVNITYHPNGGVLENDRYMLQSAFPGQEFVFTANAQILDWIKLLLERQL